jgi:hypothetical protein
MDTLYTHICIRRILKTNVLVATLLMALIRSVTEYGWVLYVPYAYTSIHIRHICILFLLIHGPFIDLSLYVCHFLCLFVYARYVLYIAMYMYTAYLDAIYV